MDYLRQLDTSSAGQNYFGDIPEEGDEQVRVKISVSDFDTDEVLRLLGVIKQIGTVSKYPSVGAMKMRSRAAHYDPGKNAWVFSDSLKPVSHFELQGGLRRRQDLVPKGAIRILGTYDPAYFLKKEVDEHDVDPEDHADIQALEQLHIKSINHLKEYKDEGKVIPEKKGHLAMPDSDSDAGTEYDASDLHHLAEAMEHDPDYISKSSIHKHVKQYLVRSLPQAAVSTNALIVVDADTHASRLLGVGVENTFPKNPVIGAHASVLGVRPYDVTKDGLDAPPIFDRTMKSSYCGRSDGMSVVPRSGDNYLTYLMQLYKDPLPGTEPHHACNQVTNYDQLCIIREIIYDLSRSRGDNTRDAMMHGEQLTQVAIHMPSHKSKQGNMYKNAFRESVPICTVLIGGDKEQCKYDLMQNVQQRWPIVIIDGSGGYAEYLCENIRKAHSLVDVTLEAELNQHYSRLDAITVEIIKSDVFRVVKKGASAEELVRILEQSLYGDQTLMKAWRKYAEWHKNALFYKLWFRNFEILILLLGILATAVSIFQTFLQLQFPEATTLTADVDTSTHAGITTLYSMLNWVVIVFPVLISLLQAVANKIDAGAKWVSLRGASEKVLREIFEYRTKTLKYSHEALLIAQSAKARDDSNVDESLKYESREELLQMQTGKIASELSETEVQDVSLSEYKGSIPPPFVTKRFGDDGLSFLNPDEYVDIRLKTKLQAYQADGALSQRAVSWLNWAGYFFGAGGTLIAALAVTSALANYNLQAWVALTTAIVNALSRYLDYSRLEWLCKKYNKVGHDLTNVETWWASRGAQGNNPRNRNLLVGKTEDLVREEVNDWEHQLKNAMEAAKQAQELEQKEREHIVSQLKAGEDVEQVAKMKELGIDKLSPKDLKSALEDPTGPQAAKVIEILAKVNDQMGDVIGQAKDAVANSEVGKAIMGNLAGAVDGIQNAAKGDIPELIPAEMRSYIIDPNLRKNFLIDVLKCSLDPTNLNRTEMLGMISKGGPELLEKVQDIPQRNLLEICRSMVTAEVTHEFFSSLSTLNISQYDLLPAGSDMDDFLCQMRIIAKLPWQKMTREQLLSTVTDEEILERLNKFQEGKFRALIKRSERILLNPTPTSQMLASVSASICKLDSAQILCDAEVLLKLNETVRQLQELPFDFELLSREDLFQRLPPEVQELRNITHSKQAILNTIGLVRYRNPEVLAFEAFSALHTQPTAEFEVLFSQDVVNRELFTLAARNFHQSAINRSNKTILVKRMSAIPMLIGKMGAGLKKLKDWEMKATLSGLKGHLANTYTAKIFDRLADEVQLFDVRQVFAHGTRPALIELADQFRNVDIPNLDKETTQHMISDHNLTQLFSKMTLSGVQELLYRLVSLSQSTLGCRLFLKSINPTFAFSGSVQENTYFNSLKRDVARYKETIDGWNVGILDRVSQNIQTNISLEFLSYIKSKSSPTAEDVLKPLADPEIHRTLSIFRPKSIIGLYTKIKALSGERGLNLLFGMVSQTIKAVSLYQKFDCVFATPQFRRALVNGLHAFHEMDISDVMKMSGEEILDAMKQAVEMTSDERDAHLPHSPSLLLDYLCGTQWSVFKPDEFKEVVRNVLSGLYVSGGYITFLAIASDIKEFDLRCLVSALSDRQVLNILVFALMNSNLFRVSTRSKKAKLQLVHTEQKQDLAAYRKSIQTVKRLVLRYTQQRGDLYQSLACVFRDMTEEQVDILMTRIVCHFEKSTLGRFLYANMKVNLADHLGGNLEDEITFLSRHFARLEFLGVVKMHVKFPPHLATIKEKFDNFNSRAFQTRMASTKKSILSGYMSTDNYIKLLVNNNEAEWKDLFKIIQAVAVGIYRPFGASQASSRLSWFQKLQTLKVTVNEYDLKDRHIVEEQANFSDDEEEAYLLAGDGYEDDFNSMKLIAAPLKADKGPFEPVIDHDQS